jgi:transposase
MNDMYVGIDLHRRRSVIYRMDADGNKLECVRIDNDPIRLLEMVTRAGPDAEVVIEATYGWYWAVDLLEDAGFRVHLAHPAGNDWGNRRVKNDERDARDLADLLRLDRLAEAWIAPPPTREARELVRYRAKLVQLRSGLISPCSPRLRVSSRGSLGTRHVSSVRSPIGCLIGCAGRSQRQVRSRPVSGGPSLLRSSSRLRPNSFSSMVTVRRSRPT